MNPFTHEPLAQRQRRHRSYTRGYLASIGGIVGNSSAPNSSANNPLRLDSYDGHVYAATVVCAWCKTVLHQGSKDHEPISHGICQACMKIHFPTNSRDKNQP